MKRHVCPGCGQVWVLPVRIKRSGTLLFLCNECDSAWLSEASIGRDGAVNFVAHMESVGMRGSWSEVELLHVDDE